MMTTRELQDKITALKKEMNACILVHAYQSHDIWEVADYVGDSYGLSVQAAETDADIVVMCGVRFMAETVKMLSPKKKVILANALASCPMADQYSGNDVIELKKEYPGRAAVAYINTTSDLKAQVDVCVTSSSALRIIKNMSEDKILFIPDQNLGGWIKEQCPEKDIQLVRGGCPSHMRMLPVEAEIMKKEHPDALLLVHPECLAGVTAQADYVGSTTGIMKFAKESDAKEFIIATEHSIVQHLQYECPDKTFLPLSRECVCHNMKMTTLPDVYNSLLDRAGEEIIMSDELIAAARKPIDRMIELGG